MTLIGLLASLNLPLHKPKRAATLPFVDPACYRLCQLTDHVISPIMSYILILKNCIPN